MNAESAAKDIPAAGPSENGGTSNGGGEARLPAISIGALLMPCIWGPAHGYWVTILYYPLLIFVDSAICSAVDYGGLAIPLATVMCVATVALTVFFAKTAGPAAYARVSDKVSLETYLKRERIWAVVSALLLVLALVSATIWNLYYRF